jgi:hypothetical protein
VKEMGLMTSWAQRAVRSTPLGRASARSRAAAARGLILAAALVSFVLSVSLWFADYRDEGLFVGIWVPTIISLGAFLIPRGVDR